MIIKKHDICIIGAGTSGISACKNFQEAGLDFICFEASDRIGGNWVFRNKNGMSSAYESLHINTSKEKMQFYDFPMPDHYPDFPHHSHIAEYFEDYVKHFGFKDKILFNTVIKQVTKIDEDRWELISHNEEKYLCNHLIVANGHHWDPKMPRFEGSFDGEVFHSHHYLNPEEPVNCKNKNILIIGAGNSAMDIASELSRKNISNKVFLSIRSPVWVTPKYFGSMTLDHFQRHPSQKKGWIDAIKEHIFDLFGEALLTKKIVQAIGKPEDIGLPKPQHKFTQAHPTISSEIQLRIGSGDLIVKKNVSSLDGKVIYFEDNSQENIDVIIYATGYKISFPFFKKSFINVIDNHLPLYKRIFHPEITNLYFIGLIQPLCALMPVVDEQSKMLTKYFQGEFKLPSKEHMRSDAELANNKMLEHYVKSSRHTIQINCTKYTDDLRKQLG